MPKMIQAMSCGSVVAIDTLWSERAGEAAGAALLAAGPGPTGRAGAGRAAGWPPAGGRRVEPAWAGGGAPRGGGGRRGGAGRAGGPGRRGGGRPEAREGGPPVPRQTAIPPAPPPPPPPEPQGWAAAALPGLS